MHSAKRIVTSQTRSVSFYVPNWDGPVMLQYNITIAAPIHTHSTYKYPKTHAILSEHSESKDLRTCFSTVRKSARRFLHALRLVGMIGAFEF